MSALQYAGGDHGIRCVEVPRPVPARGQVLVRVLAAGACGTDLHFMRQPPERSPFVLPQTLGHECVGVVDSVGDGVEEVDGVAVGDTVAVYGAWGCGGCLPCRGGAENYCVRAAGLGIRPPGLGAPGAMAQYLLVPAARHLVPCGDLDPVAAAPLTDAGLTPYHAIRGELGRLVPDATVLVVGLGGLGHLAVQILRAITAATVIAHDLDESKLALAGASGAHHLVGGGPSVPRAVLDHTSGTGADVVLDFVGSPGTTELAMQCVRVNGSIVVIGGGGGHVRVGLGSTPYGVSARSVYWGGLDDLRAVLTLAGQGRIRVRTEVFALEEGALAYERLAAGRIDGRAVVVP